MPLTRLYHSGSIKTGKIISLEKNASHHLIKVLRAKKDSDVLLFNGDGCEYAAVLLDENSKGCTVEINNCIRTQRESPVCITLFQGVSRSDRMDTCIQKSTELGVNVIVPVICDRTTTKLKGDRVEKKISHWQQVIISACEQSGRCVIPTLQPITSYLQALQASDSDCKLVLNPDSKTGMMDIPVPKREIHILVGPEGGLTQSEITLACEMNFTGIHLGPRVLRTETAGPACIASIQTLWGDLGKING